MNESPPTPAPRTSVVVVENKKPVPAPRTMIPIKQHGDGDEGTRNSTFGRKVSKISKQIAGDIVQGVNETTRASVRRITRHFSNSTIEVQVPTDDIPDDSGSDISLFNSIQFNSPIYNKDEPPNIYTDIDYVEHPPPAYPPPTLREEDSEYTNAKPPQSVNSGSTNSSDGGATRFSTNYEMVFPLLPYNSDSESCVDITSRTHDREVDLSRSASWNFYDTLPPTEQPIYNNVDGTPVLPVQEDDVSLRSFTRSNSVYENHTIITEVKEATKSILMEFDPLHANRQSNLNLDELSELEQVLQGELYGNISVFDTISVLEDEEDIYSPPPLPPMRFDSLVENTYQNDQQEQQQQQPSPVRTTWYTEQQQEAPTSPKLTTDSKPKKWLKNVNDIVFKKAPELVRSFKSKENVIQRPTLMSKVSLVQKGMLYKITNGPVEDIFGEFSGRWCVLQNGSFICYSDNTTEHVKEHMTIDSIISIQLVQDSKAKYKFESNEFNCFEVDIAGKNRGAYVYATKSLSERRTWMQKLAECMTSKFPTKITSDYTRFGWGYMKEGLSGQWIGAWLVLRKRELLYVTDDSSMRQLDLRKARCFVLEQVKDQEGYAHTTDKGPNLVVHFTSGTFYFRMWTQKQTKIWCHVLKLAAHNNGSRLHQQQLTKNDVPVIVEKCINFVYAYGSMNEGIYRRSGHSTIVADLMTLLRNDAWSVQLTAEKYSKHDVATALKRFFRDLAEPLIDGTQRMYLYQVSLVKSKDERIRMYKSIFDQMQTDESKQITYNTARTLLGHLHFISTQSYKNLMTIENLAAIWGPTLLHHEMPEDCVKDHVIAAQLMSLYKYIFHENAKQLEMERKMLTVLEKHVRSPQGSVNVKPSGDFRVWVYEFNKQGRTFNILIGPQKTAYEVLSELRRELNVPIEELVLEESILDGNLIRPIHHTEKVLDVVLKWGFWEDADRKENCLVLNKLHKYNEYFSQKPIMLAAELKYADSATKNLKFYNFEFSQSRLSCYKDRMSRVNLNTWNIEDIVWYIGHEPKRNVGSKYAITFIEKGLHPRRTKASPWFGHVISLSEPSQMVLLLSTMWISEHPELRPPPQIVNLMAS